MLATPIFSVAAENGSVKICLPSDYEWQANQKLLVPAGVIFGGEGAICGNLYQPSILSTGDKRLTCYKSDRVNNFDSAFALSENVILSKKLPCTVAHARAITWWHYTRRSIRASSSQAFIAWRIIGHPIWPRGSNPPAYVDPELARALDDFDLRAAVISDIGNPMKIDEIQSGGVLAPSDN